MKLSALVILMLLISVLVASCATPPQPSHGFSGYYKYDNEGSHIIVTGDGDHICMPMVDYDLLYEAYCLYYGIEE